MSNIPIFLIIFVSAAISIQVMLRRNSSNFKDNLKNFMQREEKAKKTYKQMPDDLPFVTPTPSELPVREYPDSSEYRNVIKRQNTAIRKTALKMLTFDEPQSNTDIKLKYGANNFDKIIILEEHYNGYMRALFDWAKALVDIGCNDDAQKVLAEALRLRTDIHGSYTLLADIYFERRDIKALDFLRKSTEDSRITAKEKTLTYIDEKITKLNGQGGIHF